MNLKEVYEIFYPGKCEKLPSVWKVPPKYRSKKEFFEELLPIEIRWLNCKIWNDKARRSRFFSNCKGESRYIASLRTFLFEQPWTISRIEGKANDLLSGQICEKVMNESFLRFSDVMDMAKRSQYTLTGLVINAFTDSVILDWNQLGTINPGGDDGEEETMYTR